MIHSGIFIKGIVMSHLRGFAAVMGVFLLLVGDSVCVRAGTVATGPKYCFSSYCAGTSDGAGQAYVAMLNGNPEWCTYSSPPHWASYTFNSSGYGAGQAYMSYTRDCGNGSTAQFQVFGTYVANTCPSGTYPTGTVCSDAMGPGGVPKAAGTSVENINVPYDPNPTFPPPKVCLNGLGYEPVSGNNQCAVGGVQQWCLTAVNDGTTCTAGSGGYVGAAAMNGAGVGLPKAADLVCSGSSIVNMTTGATTCIASNTVDPVKSVSMAVDPGTGAQSVTVIATGDSSKPSTSITQTSTPGGVTTITGGSVPGGSSSGSASITFPSDYAKSGEAASAASSINSTLGGKLDTANSKLGDMKTALTDTSATAPGDPTVKAASDISDLMPDSTFSGLKTWTLPSRSVSCPAPSFMLWGHTYTIDGHCTLWASVGSSAAAIMLLVWTIGAMLIVLGA